MGNVPNASARRPICGIASMLIFVVAASSAFIATSVSIESAGDSMADAPKILSTADTGTLMADAFMTFALLGLFSFAGFCIALRGLFRKEPWRVVSIAGIGLNIALFAISGVAVVTCLPL